MQKLHNQALNTAAAKHAARLLPHSDEEINQLRRLLRVIKQDNPIMQAEPWLRLLTNLQEYRKLHAIQDRLYQERNQTTADRLRRAADELEDLYFD